MSRRRRLLRFGIAAALLACATATHAGEERKKGGGLSFTQFRALTATVVRPDGSRGVLSAEAGIDVPDAQLKARADLLGPRLRDAYVSLLTTYAAAIPPGAPPNLDLLADRLQQATDRVVGRPGAKLLIGTVLIN